jgi:hypothetical protein
MVVHIQPSPNGDSKWNRRLMRGIMAGFIGVELAAMAWIIYKIVSPKY